MVIGVRYADAAVIADIIQAIDIMLQDHEKLDSNQTTYARFVNFGPSSLDFEVYAFTNFTRRADFLAVKQDIAMQIIKIISLHGAECAFPTTTLHIASNSSDLQEK